jgi:hypothetical protein
VSLPVSSSITNETQLLASIPHALYVEKLIESEDHFWRWSGSGSCEVWDAIKGGALVRTDKEPTATTCFNVNAGEGFAVVVDQAAEYTILGTDGSTVLSLDAIGSNSLSGFNLVSLPFCTNVSTAGQLMNSIGFANTAAVERYICATDTFQVYTGRKASSPDFVLSPGEGYLVKMNTTTNYSTQKTSCALPLCTSGVATYSVSGSADTATFAFKIDNGLGETTCFNNCVAFTTAGESSVAIADDFATRSTVLAELQQPQPIRLTRRRFRSYSIKSRHTTSGWEVAPVIRPAARTLVRSRIATSLPAAPPAAHSTRRLRCSPARRRRLPCSELGG